MNEPTEKKKGADLSSELDEKPKGDGVVAANESVDTSLKTQIPESLAGDTHTDAPGSRETVASSLLTQAPPVVQGHARTNIAYMIASSRTKGRGGMNTSLRGQDLTRGAESIRSPPSHDTGVYLTLGGKASRPPDSPPQAASLKASPKAASADTEKQGYAISPRMEQQRKAGSTDIEKTGKFSDKDMLQKEKLGAIDSYDDAADWKSKEDISVWDSDAPPGEGPPTASPTVASEDIPGAHFVAGNETISLSAAEEFTQPTYDNSSANPNTVDPSTVSDALVAELVNTEEEQQRIQDLEAQNRMLREREQNVVEARVMGKSEILKSFFNLRDPEFRRQRICAFGFIFLAVVAIVLGMVLTRDNRRGPVGPPTEAPTMPPTPEPTSEELADLTVFLSESASFDGGASILDQSTPQYQAAKWLADSNTRLDEYSDSQKIQRYALATLYFSTNGDNWTVNTNWLDDGDECDRWWQSIGTDLSCTSQNETSRILLGGNNLEGSIPPELAFLSSSLEIIELRENALTGTVPSELGLLSVLTGLDVDDNFLSGALMTEIGLLTKLDFLGMTANDFSGTIPTELYLLTNLLTLRLGNALEGSISDAIGSLTSLGELSLYENYLTGPIPSTLGLFSRLTELYLDFNELSGEIPSEIAALPSLEFLNLVENMLTGTIPVEIYNMTTLQELLLYSNMLAGTISTTFGLMTSLEKLHLDVNLLSGPLPSELGSLAGLKELLLGTNTLNGTIPSEVGLMLNMETLFLNENELTGTIPSQIGLLQDMVHLSLRDNMLTGTVPSSFNNMSKLETLWLENNDLEGPFTCPENVTDCKVSCESADEACRVL